MLPRLFQYSSPTRYCQTIYSRFLLSLGVVNINTLTTWFTATTCSQLVVGLFTGGRSQEMCLQSLVSMSNMNLHDDRAVFASIGTDGQDGPTDAAGACITPQCMMGSTLHAQSYLDNNDSYVYFSELNGGKMLVSTGLTGTNVMDIGILFLRP